MAKRKGLAVGISAFAIVVAVCGAVRGYDRLDTARSAVADNHIALADVHNPDMLAAARGAYVMRAADCAACHTADKGDFAGNYAIATPFGTINSSNITPDRETGIGTMTERDFFDAVRQGRGSKGFLYPAMPYTAYTKLTDQDLHDLWAYFATVKPVRNRVDETAGLAFPFDIRLAMAGWDTLFFDNKGYAPQTGKSAEWQRGQYLVDAAAHCSACHSPRNLLGAEKSGKYLQGGNLGAWYAPDLSGNPDLGLGQTSSRQIVDYLQTGGDGRSLASGPMAEAVEHSFQYMTPVDLGAIATYLKSLPASGTKRANIIPAGSPAMQRGALRYEVNCSACHGVAGQGMGVMTPAFAGNHALQSDDATNMIHAMLVGSRAAATHAKPTGAGMPSFAWKMDDRQIAETLDYVRNSWGNAGRPVDPADVARLRRSLGAVSTLPAN